MTNGIVVIENFERRKAVFANRLGKVSPAFVAFPTAQLVSHNPQIQSEWEEPRCRRSPKKRNPLPPQNGKRGSGSAGILAPRISCSPVLRIESWHLAARIDDPGPVAVASQGSSLGHSA